MSKNTLNKLFAGVGVVSMLALGACTMAAPSQLEVDRIEVKQGYASDHVRQGDLNDDTWGRIVADYERNATGPLNVYVSYPAELKGADTKAARVAKGYGRILTQKGVDDVIVSTVPAYDADLYDRVVVSYREMQARPPEECGVLSGQFGSESLYEGREYDMGCGNMRYISKMVSDPTDLLGKSGTWEADARRAGNVVERYRTGEGFEPLDTSNSSDVGN